MSMIPKGQEPLKSLEPSNYITSTSQKKRGKLESDSFFQKILKLFGFIAKTSEEVTEAPKVFKIGEPIPESVIYNINPSSLDSSPILTIVKKTPASQAELSTFQDILTQPNEPKSAKVIEGEALKELEGINDIKAFFKQKNILGQNAFHLAAQRGFKDLVVEMMRRAEAAGAMDALNAQDDAGFTALHLAATRGREAVMHILMGNDSTKQQVIIDDFKGNKPIHLAAAYGREEIVKIWTKNSVRDPETFDVFAKNKDGMTPAHLAAYFDHPYVLRALSWKGQEPNTEVFNDYVGRGHETRPLEIAIDRQSTKSMEFFKEREIDKIQKVEIKNIPKESLSFEKVSINDSGDRFEKIVKDVEDRLPNGETALHLAVYRGDVDDLDLIEKDDFIRMIKTPDVYGNNPIHLAVLQSRPQTLKKIVELLKPDNLDSISLTNNQGLNAIELAEKLHRPLLAQILRDTQ